MDKFSFENVLEMAQKLQRECLGKRNLNITLSHSKVLGGEEYLDSIDITIFEKDYADKKEGDLKNFAFYDFSDDYEREAQWKRLMDYYNNF